MLEIELPFTNPFRHTTMLGYNPRRDPRDGRTVTHCNANLNDTFSPIVTNIPLIKMSVTRVTGLAPAPAASSTPGMGATS